MVRVWWIAISLGAACVGPKSGSGGAAEAGPAIAAAASTDRDAGVAPAVAARRPTPADPGGDGPSPVLAAEEPVAETPSPIADDSGRNTAEWTRLVNGLRDGKRWAEAALREEVATGERPAAAAEVLRSQFATPTQERYAEALLLVETALRRTQDAALECARAELLRDLARFDDARAVLDEVAMQHPRALDRDHWLSLAELWAIEGDTAMALAILDRALVAFADQPSVPWETQVRQFRAELESGRTGTLERDVFAVLRAHDQAVERLRALAVLSGLGGETAFRAVALALDDRDPEVRALALRSLPAGVAGRRDIVEVALMDRHREVRMAGAQAARGLSLSVRRELVAPALDRESDPVVAQSMRDALAAPDVPRGRGR